MICDNLLHSSPPNASHPCLTNTTIWCTNDGNLTVSARLLMSRLTNSLLQMLDILSLGPTDVPNRALLKVNRQFYIEASQFLYSDCQLTIVVSPKGMDFLITESSQKQRIDPPLYQWIKDIGFEIQWTLESRHVDMLLTNMLELPSILYRFGNFTKTNDDWVLLEHLSCIKVTWKLVSGSPRNPVVRPGVKFAIPLIQPLWEFYKMDLQTVSPVCKPRLSNPFLPC